MKRIKLDRKERAIESALLMGEYRSVRKTEFKRIAKALDHRKKKPIR